MSPGATGPSAQPSQTGVCSLGAASCAGLSAASSALGTELGLRLRHRAIIDRPPTTDHPHMHADMHTGIAVDLIAATVGI